MSNARSPIIGFSVYFVQPEGSDKVKIGLTNDLEARLKSFQTGSPEPFVVLHQIMTPARRCSERMERKLHRRFDSYRYNGEWFRLEGELADYLDDPDEHCTCVECRGKLETLCQICDVRCDDGTPFMETRRAGRFCAPCLDRLAKSDDPDQRRRANQIMSSGRWRFGDYAA